MAPFSQTDWLKRDGCPSCGSKHSFFDESQSGRSMLNYEYCKSCNLVFMNPVPNQNWYNTFYAESFWEQKGIVKNMDKARNKILKQGRWGSKLYRFLKMHIPASKSIDHILEVGCGYGLIVRALAERFHAEPHGVEPSPFVSNIASKQTGIKIVASNMDELSGKEASTRYDLIVNSHMLENIVDLQKAMTTYRTLLKKGGLLLIDTPNLFIQRSLGIVHPYVFCERSLRFLLQDSGFKVLGLKKSGWGKSVFVPRHLTILAQINELGRSVSLSRPSNSLFKLKNVLGQALARSFSNHHIANVDNYLVTRWHTAGQYEKVLIDKVANNMYRS